MSNDDHTMAPGHYAGKLADMTSEQRAALDLTMSRPIFAVAPAEHDPSGLDAHAPGAKLDAGKVPALRGSVQQFPRALNAVAAVSAFGAAKYTWNGWESVPDGVQRYTDAMGRHLFAEQTEGPIDADSGLLHAAQVAWNALARLELMLRQRGGVW